MLVHSVFFWLKDGMNEDETKMFEQGLESLTHIDSVNLGYFGAPAKTDRPVIDKTYTYGLTIINENCDLQMEYQVDPMHKKFVNDFEKYFEKVVVYDFE